MTFCSKYMKALITLAIIFTALVQAPDSHGAMRIPVERVQHLLVVSVDTQAGQRRFAVDTGAGITLIPRRMAAELGHNGVDSLTVRDYLDNAIRTGMVTIPEFRFGGDTFRNIGAVVLDDDHILFSCMGLDGIIGTNILRHFAIRFTESEIILGRTAEDLDIPKGTKSTAVRNFHPSQNLPGTPWVMLKLCNGKRSLRHPFMIDTGAESLTLSDWERLDEEDIASRLVSTVGYSSALGISDEIKPMPLHFGIIPEMRFANIQLRNMSGASSPTSIIGTNLLTFGDLVIDFPRCRAFLIPAGKDGGTRERLRNVTPSFDREKGYVIGAVWDARIGNARPGDRIVEVNGTSTEGWNACRALSVAGKVSECVIETSEGRCRIQIRNILEP